MLDAPNRRWNIASLKPIEATPKTEHRRPGKAARAKVYEPFVPYPSAAVAPGTKPIWLYLRRSNFHDDGGDAIERHRLDLSRKLAADGGWTVMGEYVDNDSASKTASKTRKGWHLLLKAIEDSSVTAVAIWKLDRASRVAWKNMEWLARCAELGVKIVSYSDPEVATQDSSAKILVALKSALAEVETDIMSARQLNAKAHAAEAGFSHGGIRPIGWMPSGERETDEHGRSGIRLVPHPIEFPALQDAIKMAIAGSSLQSIAKYWAEVHGIVTAGGHPIYQSTLWRILRNPRLMGYRLHHTPRWEKGEKVNRGDLIAYVVRGADGEPIIAHEPACDRLTFMRLQRSLSQRSNSAVRKPWGTHEWLLTGLMFCGDCGERLYGLQKINRDKSKTFVYKCIANRRRGPGTCGGLSVSGVNAENYVVGWIVEYVTDDRLAKAMRRTDDQVSEISDPLTAELSIAHEERAMLIQQQSEGSFRGAMVAHFLRLMEEVEARIESLERQTDVAPAADLPATSHSELVNNWPDWSLDQKRHTLRQTIAKIVVKPGHMPIDLRLDVTPRF
jgi:site-specific DNA recombinase